MNRGAWITLPLLLLAATAACGGPGGTQGQPSAGPPGPQPPPLPAATDPGAPPATASGPTTTTSPGAPPSSPAGDPGTSQPSTATTTGPSTPATNPGSTSPPATNGGSAPPTSTTTPPATPPPSGSKYRVEVDCSPVNTFGYVASASGEVDLLTRKPDGTYTVRGTLDVRYHLYGDPETEKQVTVEGTLDRAGKDLSARVTSGPPELSDVFLVFDPAFTSSTVNSVNGGASYQTSCGKSTVKLPQGADLRPDGTLRFYDRGDGTIGVQVNVVNIGNAPGGGAKGRADVGGKEVDAAVHQYFGGTATAPNTVNPGERGYVLAVLPKGSLARCTQVAVDIDVDQTFQPGTADGAFDPSRNDRDEAQTPCVTWSRTIDADSLGEEPGDPIIVGETLASIVGSFAVARESDKNACSACHNDQKKHVYAPPIAAGAAALIAPTDTIAGTTWAAQGGWADQFQDPKNGKPGYLTRLFQLWKLDGARP